MEFKSNRRHQDFAKVQFTRIIRIKTFLERVLFGGTNSGGEGKIFRPTKMLVFAMVIVFLTFLGLGDKILQVG